MTRGSVGVGGSLAKFTGKGVRIAVSSQVVTRPQPLASPSLSCRYPSSLATRGKDRDAGRVLPVMLGRRIHYTTEAVCVLVLEGRAGIPTHRPTYRRPPQRSKHHSIPPLSAARANKHIAVIGTGRGLGHPSLPHLPECCCWGAHGLPPVRAKTCRSNIPLPPQSQVAGKTTRSTHLSCQSSPHRIILFVCVLRL